MIIEAGIISFTTWLGGKIADKGFDIVVDSLKSKDDIDTKFRLCVEVVAKKLEKKYPDILGNSINYFFTQEEVFGELIKLLFVNQIVNEEVIAQFFDNSTLPKDFILEFVTELKAEVQQETVFQELLANKELYIALTGISKKVEDISKNSTLTAIEITEIRKLLQKQFIKEFNLSNYVSNYKEKLINNIKTVNFLGLGIDPSIKKGKRKELNSVFVHPIFKKKSKYHLEIEKNDNRDIFSWFDNDEVSFSKLFDKDYNYIILGNAGSGKSMLIKAIMFYISENSQGIFSREEILTYIPFSIELKKYIAFKKQGDKGCTILKYLLHSFDSDYFSSIVEDNLKEILEKEKVILFFDGLDEIFNENDKISVKNDIENFLNDFQNIKSITTSRFSGYNDVKFDEKKFCEMSVLPFKNEQIREYVQKWYELEEEDTEVRDSEIKDFISKMDNIDDELTSNPLLLSLIVILYRNNLKLPESKLEIYQSCTNTLVDKWDKHREIKIDVESAILEKKESILSDLAFWQYEKLSSSNNLTITSSKAKTIIADSLVKKKLADDDNKNSKAESFLEYARKRSIYFDNNFTHKTFLEYYAAYWIYSNIEKKNKTYERNKIIKQYIKNPFWYIVLELLLSLIDKDQPDTEILDKIIEENSNDTDSLAFLLYVLPSLKNISADTQILVYTKTIEHILSLKSSGITDNEKQCYSLFDKINKNATNPKQTEIINKSVNDFQNKDLAFYVLMEELCGIDSKFDFTNNRNSFDYKEFINVNPYLFLLSDNNNGNKCDYLDVTLKYIKLFGVDLIFEEHRMWFKDTNYFSMIHYCIYFQMLGKNIDSLSVNLETLENNSVSKIRLLKQILEESNFEYNLFRDEDNDKAIQYLFDTIENASEIEKVIYLILLSPIFRYSKNIDDFKTRPQIKDILSKIQYESNMNKLREIINELKISDKAILQLYEDLNSDKK